MTNETKWTSAASVALETTGASVANAAFINAASGLASAGHSNYPYADFVLKINGFGASIASNANGYVSLFAVPQNMLGVGAADAGVPSASYRSQFLGTFLVPNSLASTAVVYLPCFDVPIGADQNFTLENVSSQTLAAGWTLSVQPKAIIPG